MGFKCWKSEEEKGIAMLEQKLASQADNSEEDKPVTAGAVGPSGDDAPTEEPAAKQDTTGHADSDAESEDNDDDVDENWEPPAAAVKKAGKMRGSVSAEAYGEWNKKVAYVPVVVPKSAEQKDRLKKILGESFMFANLDEKDFNIVIDAMEEMRLEPNFRIITKGDDGDCMYVVESGKLECKIVKEDGDLLVVKVCEEGDAFGELALLYNCPRAAHVDAGADGESVIWKLSRECFNGVVKDAAAKKRERCEAILAKVEMFTSMSGYEKGQIADALRNETAKEGEAIITEGEPGNMFYILEEGTAAAFKGDAQVKDYESGGYFGELAILNSAPRAATVKALSDCKLLTMDRRTFKKLLGPVEEIMKRNSEQYAGMGQ